MRAILAALLALSLPVVALAGAGGVKIHGKVVFDDDSVQMTAPTLNRDEVDALVLLMNERLPARQRITPAEVEAAVAVVRMRRLEAARAPAPAPAVVTLDTTEPRALEAYEARGWLYRLFHRKPKR